MARFTPFVSALVFYCFTSFVTATNWICPASNSFCYQRINEPPRSWNASQARCVEIGGDLPGEDHSHELARLRINEGKPFWTSLCFSNGRLQWLGIKNSYVERDLSFIGNVLPDLTRPADGQMYCFETGRNPLKTFELKHSQDLANAICISDVRSLIRQPTFSPQRGQILSVSAVTEGADIDWGPIGQNRDGFMNIFPPKTTSLKLKCDVRTTSDVDKSVVTIRWLRNGGYARNFSQELVSFASEEDLIPWIGFITCEATYRNQVITGRGFHLVMWNTVTTRLVSTCTSCQLSNTMDAAKIILAQFVEEEITPGAGNTLEFHTEPPVITGHFISSMIHIINKKIEKFDFKMAQKLGQYFELSHWAKSRSLFLPKGNFDLLLDVISPCNMALPQDRGNITWTGYLGQTVPSGNFIGEPICVDNRGDIITRSCGLPDLRPIRFQKCSAMKDRKEEPPCFHGFEKAPDGNCYRITEVTRFSSAVSKCWAGWPLQPEILKPKTVTDWIRNSQEGTYRIQSASLRLVWLPFRQFNKAMPLQSPIWNWNTASNRWILQANDWDIGTENREGEELCMAYDLTHNRIITKSCQDRLPMICNRQELPSNISFLISSQAAHARQVFCDEGWLTHLLVIDAGICYKRFTLKVAVDADEAQHFCIQQGGHLAVAPTHNMRIALEQVYAIFNNQSIVDSWIGLRNRGEKPGAFKWVNETAGVSGSSTYNWQPFQEFGSGYGVSTGITRAWWNWPRDAKIWGVLCQKTLTNWQTNIHLLLEKLSNNEYALVFNYNSDGCHQEKKQGYPESRKPFWQSEFDVVCYFNNYAMHIRFPVSREYYRVHIPGAMGSGRLICEGWLNRPVIRFQSNTVIHRTDHENESQYDSYEYY